MQEAVPQLPGMDDLDPVAFARQDTVRRSVLQTFALAGFEQVDVPVLENLELYLRKNGAQVLPRVYSFLDPAKQEVALRPEYTAPVIRAFARRAQAAGGPIRVAYAGPVFRYEDPAPAVARQFTQVGVELLGDAQPQADADVIALACDAARAAGAGQIGLVLGHLGPIRSVLSLLDVGTYAEQYLLEHLELFGRGAGQQALVRQRLGLLDADQAAVTGDDERLAGALARAVRDASPDEARDLVAAIVNQMGVSLQGSTRSPEDILDRMLHKAQRRAAVLDGRWQRALERALLFLEHLCALRGPAPEVMEATARLLADHGLPDDALADLRQVLRYLQDHDLRHVRVEVAPGMARGIAYYSGTIFEIHAGAPTGTTVEIGGGGRYDALAQALAATPCPALGFAFNLQRLAGTVASPRERRPARVLVRPEPGVARGRIHAVLQQLRMAGFPAVAEERPAHVAKPDPQVPAHEYAAQVSLSSQHGDLRLQWLDPAPAPEQIRALTAVLDQVVEREQSRGVHAGD